jgi:membrane-associated progesterone receptor component
MMAGVTLSIACLLVFGAAEAYRQPSGRHLSRPRPFLPLNLCAHGGSDGRAADSRLAQQRLADTWPPPLSDEPKPIRFDAWEFARIIIAELLLFLRAEAMQAARRARAAAPGAREAERRRRAFVSPKPCWTLDELRAYDGRAEGEEGDGPILLAANGEVFNVGTARGFYGPGGEYHALAGRDATRLLARMRTEEEPEAEARVPLTLAERATLAAWLFQLRSKYEVVGKLDEEL